jgi:hypothetical protein
MPISSMRVQVSQIARAPASADHRISPIQSANNGNCPEQSGLPSMCRSEALRVRNIRNGLPGGRERPPGSWPGRRPSGVQATTERGRNLHRQRSAPRAWVGDQWSPRNRSLVPGQIGGLTSTHDRGGPGHRRPPKPWRAATGDMGYRTLNLPRSAGVARGIVHFSAWEHAPRGGECPGRRPRTGGGHVGTSPLLTAGGFPTSKIPTTPAFRGSHLRTLQTGGRSAATWAGTWLGWGRRCGVALCCDQLSCDLRLMG